LLCTCYKLYSKIINNRLQCISDAILMEDQTGFRKGRSCIDDVFSLKMIIAKRVEFNLETHLSFVDYEKAFDRVKRGILWDIMIKRGFPKHLVEVVKSCYYKTKIVIDCGGRLTEEIVVNTGVRQGCPLSPTLFNIYIDDLNREWKLLVNPGIQISPTVWINSMLFADDQVILQESEEELQRAMYQLSKISAKYNMKVSTSKTKVMAFWGKYPRRSKIVVENKIVEQVSHFNYLGCDVTYNEDKDCDKKLHKFQAICGTIRRTLQRKARNETQIKFYKVMAVPTILYGSEVWVTKERQLSRVQAAEMRYLRSVKGCTREDHIRNEDIRRELRVAPLCEVIKNNKENWRSHVTRMQDGRYPKEILNYRPTGKRSIGRPRKRW
jgi:hypothetical protein